ncbi:MAG: hypothetical protein V3T77_06550 [Planctomycetota bacterium]
MIQRTYDSSELRCSCVLEAAHTGLVRAEVSRISSSEVHLETEVSMLRNDRLEVVLGLAGGESMVLPARVVDSGEGGLLLRWDHTAPTDAEKLAELLAAKAGASPCPAAERPAKKDNGREQPRSFDVAAAIQQRARRVHSSQIAALHDMVRVLDIPTITKLVQEAVEEAVGQSDGTLSDEQRRRLQAETEEIFKERLDAFRMEKADLEGRHGRLRGQLDKARGSLKEERLKLLEQGTFSGEEIVRVEERLGRLLDHAVQKGGGGDVVEQELRGLISKLLSVEREKISESERQAQLDRISLLGRKISRLARALENTQRERDLARHRAQVLETTAGGIAFRNIMEPGIAPDDPLKSEKLNLLKELVEQNQKLRKYMLAKSTLPK